MAKFSLKRKEVEVELELEDGKVAVYTMKELTGKQRDAFLGIMSGKMKFAQDGKPAGVKDYTNIQSTLLSMCMYDPQDQAVPMKVVDDWPSSMQTELFKKAQELSGLGDQKKTEEEAKND